MIRRYRLGGKNGTSLAPCRESQDDRGKQARKLIHPRRTYWDISVKPAESRYDDVMDGEQGVLKLLDDVVSGGTASARERWSGRC